MSKRVAVLVLGVHRSGTSAFTRALSVAGFQLPKTLMPAQLDNPEGFFESEPIAAFNEQVLVAQDSSWDGLFPPNTDRLKSTFGGNYVEAASELIKHEFGDAPFIVIKDPRICLLSAIWREAAERCGYEVFFAIVIREPEDVARSLTRRNGFSLDRGRLLWLTNILEAEFETRSQPRAFVQSENFLRQPVETLLRFETSLPIPLPRWTAAAALELSHAKSPEVRYFERASTEAPTALGRLCSTVSERLQRAAAGDILDEVSLDEVREKLRNEAKFFGEIVAEFRQHLHRLNLEVSTSQQAQSKLVDAEATIESFKHTEHELRAEASELTARHTEELGRLTNIVREVSEDRDRLAAELQALVQREVEVTSEFEGRRTAAEQEISRLTAACIDLRSANSILEVEVQTLTKNFEELHAEMTDVRARSLEEVRELNAAIAELNVACSQRERDFRSIARSYVEAVPRNAAEAGVQAQTIERLISLLTDQKADLFTSHVHIRSLEENVSAEKARGRSLSDAFEKQAIALQELSKELKILTCSRARLEEDLRTQLREEEAARRTAEDIAASLSAALSHIQARPWWRAASWLKKRLA